LVGFDETQQRTTQRKAGFCRRKRHASPGALVLEMEALLELLELEQLRRHGDGIYVRKVFGEKQHNGNEN